MTPAPFYLVCNAFNGKMPFVSEADLKEATREKTVEAIADGQYDCGTTVAVWFCDPANGVMTDETKSVFEDVVAYMDTEDMTPGWQLANVIEFCTGRRPPRDYDHDDPDRFTEDHDRAYDATVRNVRIAMGTR
jgi:hypothetical protein